MTTPRLESVQQEVDIVNGVDVERAFEFVMGPADELHIVSINDLRIVVVIIHEC